MAIGYQADREGSHAYLHYDNVRVAKENMLGPRGGAFLVAQTRLGGGRIHHAMRTVGHVQRCLDMMLERAVSRQRQAKTCVGRSRPLRFNSALANHAPFLQSPAMAASKATRPPPTMQNVDRHAWFRSLRKDPQDRHDSGGHAFEVEQKTFCGQPAGETR